MSTLLLKNLANRTNNIFQKNTFFNFTKQRDLGKYNLVQCGKVAAERAVPQHIQKPAYYYNFQRPGNTLGEIEIKNAAQIASMSKSCQLAAQILHDCETIIKTGTTTDEIDCFVHEAAIKANAYPSPLRYAGFPKSVCTSVNNVACHGIPDDRALQNGDIINVDITVYFDGYHGDCSKTFLVGQVDEHGRYLVACTAECLQQCIELCAPGVAFHQIGCHISNYCQAKNLNCIPAFIGHGIGSYFHGPPEILHYANDLPGVMQTGMTFTIEPILSLGGCEIEIQEDGWTAMSVDGARSAQFEHTVLITEHNAVALTKI